jgi:hypothetical protein
MDRANPGGQVVAVGRGQRVRRWLAQRGLRQWWKAGVVAILAIAALFGGLDTVDTKVTPFKQGQEFSDGQFTVVVERARLIDELRGGTGVFAPARAGLRYLGVVATLRNDGTIPGRLPDELDLRDVEGKEFSGVLRLRDGSLIQTLGPGSHRAAHLRLEHPEDAVKSGEAVTLRVWKKTYTQLKVAYGGEQWIDSLTDYGAIVLPVGCSVVKLPTANARPPAR